MTRLRLIATVISAVGLITYFAKDNFSGVASTVISVVSAAAVAIGPYVLAADFLARRDTQPSAGHLAESAREQENLAWRPRQSRRRGILTDKTALLRMGEVLGRAVDHLLGHAAHSLPTPFQERFTEEWADHRSYHHGWRLFWWALCVRATATRTARELRTTQLPHPDR